MNKKMEKLYAETNFLFRWVNELKTEHDADPEAFNKEDLVVQIGLKIIDLSEQLSVERKVYQNQPLWKKLINK